MDELDKILSDPLFDISPEEKAIFTLSDELREGNARQKRRRESSLERASRRPCADFETYRLRLEQVHSDLQQGIRQLLRPRKATTPRQGGYYVVGGELFYLAEVMEQTKAQNRMKDGRTRCIYISGMESDPLLETLRKGLDKEGGYLVTEPEPEDPSHLVSAQTGTPQEDTPTGYIYILRSRSTHPDIKGRPDLYKIGFTTTRVEERIAGAASDPTYLCAPVEIVERYATYGIDTQTFEGAIHRILFSARLQLTLSTSSGESYTPREWFVCPLPMIRRVIDGILDGSIAGSVYNATTGYLEEHRAIDQSIDFQTDLTGLRVLTLTIYQGPFDDIASGEKTVEYRALTTTTMRRYTYVDKQDGKRYLRPYDLLRLYVGYHKRRDCMLVRVTDIRMCQDEANVIEYHLGEIIELHRRDDPPQEE